MAVIDVVVDLGYSIVIPVVADQTGGQELGILHIGVPNICREQGFRRTGSKISGRYRTGCGVEARDLRAEGTNRLSSRFQSIAGIYEADARFGRGQPASRRSTGACDRR